MAAGARGARADAGAALDRGPRPGRSGPDPHVGNRRPRLHRDPGGGGGGDVAQKFLPLFRLEGRAPGGPVRGRRPTGGGRPWPPPSTATRIRSSGSASAVEGLFGLIMVDGRRPYAAALVREHLRLSESRPEELRAVLQPFVDILRVELEKRRPQRRPQGRRRRPDGPHPVPSRRLPPPRPHLPSDRRVPPGRGRRPVDLLRCRPPALMNGAPHETAPMMRQRP